MKAVCVFCGSNVGRNPAYRQAAISVGTALAQAGVRLVYGGGKIGLMGAVADAAVAAGGHIKASKTTVLMTGAEGVEAMRQADTVSRAFTPAR